jgi:predicted transposase YdaD
MRELRRDEQLQDLEPLLSFFTSFVLDIPLVQQIMRWDMTVLRESPWYQEILKEGLEQGEKQGRLEGRQEGESLMVLRLLQRRLGTLDDTVKQQIQMLPVEQLESLAEELLDFRDVQQLQRWLEDLS